MKQKFIIFYLMCLPVFSTAQFDYSIDFVFSRDYNSVISFSPTGNLFGPIIIGDNNFRKGGNFNLKLANNFVFKTGLRFVTLGIKDKTATLNVSNLIGLDGIKIDPALPGYFYGFANLRLIEIPLIPRYEYRKKDFSFFIELGIAPNIAYATKLGIDTDLGIMKAYTSSDDIKGKRLIMSYVLGLGVNYHFSDSYQFFIQSTVRDYRNIANEFMFVNEYRSVGAEFGIRRALNFKR